MKMLIVSVLLMLIGSQSIAADFKEGRDYLKVQRVSPTILQQVPSHKIVVTEFFSYGCPACFRLEPALADWQQHLPAVVQFSRIPVEFETTWRIYARVYYTLLQLNAPPSVSQVLFQAIQKNKLHITPEAIANFVGHYGIHPAQFLAIYHSPLIEKKIKSSNQFTQQLLIFQVPTILIDNQYRVDPSLAGASSKRLFDTVNYVIQQQINARHLG